MVIEYYQPNTTRCFFFFYYICPQIFNPSHVLFPGQWSLNISACMSIKHSFWCRLIMSKAYLSSGQTPVRHIFDCTMNTDSILEFVIHNIRTQWKALCPEFNSRRVKEQPKIFQKGNMTNQKLTTSFNRNRCCYFGHSVHLPCKTPFIFYKRMKAKWK